MNPRYYIIIIVLIVIVVGGILLFNNTDDGSETDVDNEPVACAADVRECSDGSFVSRVAPSCQFASCPTGSTIIEPDSTESGDNQSSEEMTDAITVRYTGSQFSPKTVTIKQGQTVLFINDSDRPMWVGSDIHPTHSLYPEKSDSDCLGSSFDQCGSGGRGTEYEFTFERTGVWGYHNHVAPGHTGTITVQ
ncbi:MAG: hypothetical protein Q8P86_03920 [bacterium]|nr:hypothetical protein [bacterium]